MPFKVLNFLFLFIGFFATCSAQDTTFANSQVEIKLYDKTVLKATVINKVADSVFFRNESIGLFKIAKSDIKSIKYLSSGTKDADLHYRSYQSSLYLFGSSAYSLKKGEAYYRNIWVLINHASYGINDNLTVGLGVIPTFILGLATPAWFTVKYANSIITSQLRVGAGVLVGSVIGSDEFVGLGYGLATYGSKEYNFSLGYYHGRVEGRRLRQYPLISGMARLGSRFYLIGTVSKTKHI